MAQTDFAGSRAGAGQVVLARRYRAYASSARRALAILIVAVACVQLAHADADPVTRLIAAAFAQTQTEVTYDGSYRRIDYPNGDVPPNIGVCTDVVIRAYRAVGIDLQRLVHEDMRSAFDAYPKIWGARRPDSNIDHRRVPNLQTYFRRRGAALAVSSNAASYRPGDLVTWMLPGNLPHIGMVSNQRSRDGVRPMIIHNIGRGPQVEDMLFAFPVTGHYRFRPAAELE